MAKLLSNQTADKLRYLLNREVGRLQAQIPPPPHRDYPKPDWQHIRIVSGVIQTQLSSDSDSEELDMDIDYYAGVVVVWNAKTRSLTEYGGCWVTDVNEASMSVGSIYTCQRSGNLSLHVACAEADESSDSDSDSDSEQLCESDSDPEGILRPLFVHGDPGGGGGTDLTVLTCARLVEV